MGFGMNPGSDRVYNSITGAWEDTYNEAPNIAYLGWGIYVTKRVSGDENKRKAAWSAAAHLGGKDISLWMSAYPSGFQPYRNSHFQYDEWKAAGLQAIPRELHEATEVDGTPAWKRFWEITFPLMLPVSITAILIRIIFKLKLADVITNVTSGEPGGATDSVNRFTF